MNELLKVELGFDKELGYFVSSRVIAQGLGKRHYSVLRDIGKIAKNNSPQICGLLKESPYRAANGKMNKEYKLTKDGFILYMFNVQGYNDFKMAYINKFNQIEKSLDISVLSLQEELRAKDKVIELLSKGLPYNSNVRVVKIHGNKNNKSSNLINIPTAWKKTIIKSDKDRYVKMTFDPIKKNITIEKA